MSVPTQDITVITTGLSRLTSMFANQPNTTGILKSLLWLEQDLENAIYTVILALILSGASNTSLDILGDLVFCTRNGDSDAVYLQRILIQVATNNSKGTPDEMINLVSLVYAGVNARYLDGPVGGDFSIFGPTTTTTSNFLLMLKSLGAARPASGRAVFGTIPCVASSATASPPTGMGSWPVYFASSHTGGYGTAPGTAQNC